jgi:hypothetical protein
MLVATFAPASGWGGRRITYESGRFVLEGHGVVPPAALVDYDRRGLLLWVSDEMRSWGYEMERWAAAVQQQSGPIGVARQSGPPGAAQQGGLPGAAQQGGLPGAADGGQGGGAPVGGATAPKKRLPGWAVAVLVLAGLVLVGGIIAAIAIPMLLLQSDRADESAVREGVLTIQIGIRAWAVDHGDVYPGAELIDQAHMGRYVPDWPQNPYTGGPMSRGTTAGDFWYEVTPDGSDYRLTGFGQGGREIMSVGGPDGGGMRTI